MLLQKTQMGRGLRAIAESPSTAEILGVMVTRLVPMVFVIGGLFAALGGMLFALNYQQVQPLHGRGGRAEGHLGHGDRGHGQRLGLRARRAAHRRVEVLSIHFFNADFVDFSVYGLLLVILFFKPTGLLGASGIVREKF